MKKVIVRVNTSGSYRQPHLFHIIQNLYYRNYLKNSIVLYVLYLPCTVCRHILREHRIIFNM